ncbi:hypothetical protein KAR91_67445 [Candidatus Pacearchaeota archaeon]|nr:hypothetical protein [Candidatus Pacearchaeota archaeon]
MAVFYFKWQGHITSTNRWTAIRLIKNKRYHPGMSIYKQFIPMVYQTAEYKTFKTSLANAMRGVKLAGYYDLRLKVSLWRVRDTDGPLKAVMDALEDAAVIENDRKIRNVSIIRAYHAKNEKDILIIELFKPKPLDNSWAGDKELSLFE